MLKMLDVLIGATTVVLVFSMAVTVITQALTTMVGRRGRHLRAGLADLLQQLGIPERDVAVKISQAVLTHPLFTEGKSWWGGGKPRLGTVISREDFTKILLDAAAAFTPANNAPANAPAPANAVALAPSTLWKDLDETAGQKLAAMLQANGISDPAGTLKNVRELALQLEINNPELASDVRQSLALMQEAKSDYVARVNSWFDQTIDRVSQRFTKYTHYVTFAMAAIVVLAVQLDIIAVVDRLSVDDHFREQIVNSAINNFQTQTPDKNAKPKDHEGAGTPQTSSEAAPTGTAGSTTSAVQSSNGGTTTASSQVSNPGAGDNTSNSTPATAGTTITPETSNASGTAQPPAAVTAATTPGNATVTSVKRNAASSAAQTGNNAKTVVAEDKVAPPASDSAVPKVDLNDYYNELSGAGLIASPLGYNWKEQWSPRKIPGMIIAILLISLGAPFWYNILKNLLGLRSAMAQKDDAQRALRQTTQDMQPSVTAITTDVAAVAPAWLKGERGDVDAIG